MKDRFTPDNLTSLSPFEVFVFGSNTEGEHVGGAAYFALKKFGAEYGKGEGIQGQSYAIPTCTREDIDGKRITIPFKDVSLMRPYIERFILFAKACPSYTFYVTKIGCGIAGFKVNEVAPLFKDCVELDNVVLPIEFIDYIL